MVHTRELVIDFFRKEEGKTQFLAVESLNLIYNLLTTLLIIIFFNSLQNPQEMLMGRFSIVVGTFAVISLYTLYPSASTPFLRMASQMAL